MAKRKRGHGQNSASRDPSAVDPADAKLTINSFEDVADSEDEFHINQDKIAFGDGNDAKRAKRSTDEAMELSDEEVLGYSDAASEEEEIDEEGDDDASEASREDKDVEDEDEDEISGWGTSKADYYNADKLETEQDALDEEAEARRIQQKRLKALKEADFGFDENEWMNSGAQDGEQQKSGVVTEVLPQLQVTDAMGSAERLKLLKARYPEFEPLANEMVDLQPIHARLAKEAQRQLESDSGELPTWSIAVLKYNALSSYLGALAMYFAVLTSPAAKKGINALPLEPSELRTHEVMDSLVRCRDLWQSTNDLPDEEELAALQRGSAESSLGTPEPTEEESQSNMSDEEPIELRTSKQATKEEESKSASELRRAARLRQTEEALAALTSSIRDRQRHPNPTEPLSSTTALTQQDGTSRSRRGVEGDASDSDADIGDEPSAPTGRRKKSLKFYTSQLAQKANKRANAGRNYGGDEDVPHRERLRDRQERLNREAEKRGGKKDRGGADLDDGEDDAGDGEITNAEREATKGGAHSDEDEAAQALEAKMQAKKAAKEQRKREAKEGADADATARQEQRSLMRQIEEEGGEGRRDVGYAIAKNKGLAPKRKKEVRNPRVKKRKRYEDKSKKLRSMKQTYKGGEGRGGYGGELTGIKKGLVRSVKLT